MLNCSNLIAELRKDVYKDKTVREISDMLNEKSCSGPIPIYEVVCWSFREQVLLTDSESTLKFFYKEDVETISKRLNEEQRKTLEELTKNRFSRAQLLGYYWLSPDDVTNAIIQSQSDC